MSGLRDADYATRDFEAAAACASAGVCPLCEEPLDPRHPKWDPATFPRIVNRAGECLGRITADDYAKQVGPVADVGIYHARCLDESCG